MRAALMLGLGPPWIAGVSFRAFPGFMNYYLVPTPPPPPPPPNPGPQLSQTCSVGCGTNKPQSPKRLDFLVQMERADGGVVNNGVVQFFCWFSTPGPGRGREAGAPHCLGSLQKQLQVPSRTCARVEPWEKQPPSPSMNGQDRPVARATQRGRTAPWLRAQTVVQIPPLPLASDQFLTC